MTPMAPEQRGGARPDVRAIASLFILAAIVGLNTVDRNMFGLLLPSIRADIPLSDASLGFLMGPAFVIVYSTMGIPLGWLADRTSRRGIIASGLAFWSLVTIATGFAGSFATLLVARMALGAGEASNMAPTSALIGDTFKGRSRVLAMSVFAAGGPLAMMACYPMIGWIVANHSWRMAFFTMGAIGLAVTLVMLAVVREPERSVAKADADALPIRAAAIQALRSPPFWLMVIAGTLLNINYSAMVMWLPTFMTRVHGLGAQETSLLLSAYKGGVGVIATFAAGFLVAFLMRYDRRWLAWGPVLCCVAMVPAQLMLLLAQEPLWWHIGLAIETAAMAATTPCTFPLVLALLHPRIRATGMGIYLFFFGLIGQSVGPWLVGRLNDGPMAGFGELAVRYSLLTAPVAIAAAAVFFIMLGPAISRISTEEEAA
ncbi:MFS transporter [Sphingomonas canadensis]|uniref:MFS transporter n=1 Tax=Sphingomonas canadensis TaxID=1219257 RepID=A0ABW3H8L3_9SPHN|nr:MFS transporter [Sphingomonas canadensis]MCW3836991.1 MFS transporter [Sphingomonas canadensis]